MPGWQELFRPHMRACLEILLEGPRTLSQLSDMLGRKKPTLIPHLRELQRLGVVAQEEVRTRTGREVRYRLLGASVHLEVDPARGVALAWGAPGAPPGRFPLLAQVPDPTDRAKLDAALAATEDALGAPLPDASPFVVLFGSFARGEATWKSDVDLLFVTDAPAAKARLRDALAGAQDSSEHPLRAQFTSRVAFLEGRRKLDEEAAREGIVVAAAPGEDALWRRMTRSRRISI